MSLTASCSRKVPLSFVWAIGVRLTRYDLESLVLLGSMPKLDQIDTAWQTLAVNESNLGTLNLIHYFFMPGEFDWASLNQNLFGCPYWKEGSGGFISDSLRSWKLPASFKHTGRYYTPIAHFNGGILTLKTSGEIRNLQLPVNRAAAARRWSNTRPTCSMCWLLPYCNCYLVSTLDFDYVYIITKSSY